MFKTKQDIAREAAPNHKLLGQTLAWGGWWFTIEPRKIIARPDRSQRGIGGDIELRVDYYRDDLTFSDIRTIMQAVNGGAMIRGRQIRASLGVADERTYNPADKVWRDDSPKYFVFPGPHGEVLEPWYEYV